MTNRESRESRFYYQPLVRLILRGYGVFGFVVCITLIAAPRIPAAFRFLIAVGSLGYLYVSWHFGGLRGLEARAEGVYYRRCFRARFVPWREINTFRIKTRSLSPPVLLELESGEMNMMPFTQGRLTRWKGGKSRDTVAILNNELSQAKETGRPERHGPEGTATVSCEAVPEGNN